MFNGKHSAGHPYAMFVPGIAQASTNPQHLYQSRVKGATSLELRVRVENLFSYVIIRSRMLTWDVLSPLVSYRLKA